VQGTVGLMLITGKSSATVDETLGFYGIRSRRESVARGTIGLVDGPFVRVGNE